jgi:hypothetical protein
MAKLSAHQRQLLNNIPVGQTMTIQGAARNEACRVFALTGGQGGNEVVKVFSIVNAMDGQMLNIALGEAAIAVGEAALDNATIRWAQRQYDKFNGNQYRYSAGGRLYAPSAGKYNAQYVAEKIIKRSIEASGLSMTSSGTDYYLCMHWPTADGVAEEHWWLEVHGYTIEIIPRWHDIMIYSPRGADPGHYSQVRVGLKGLLQAHIARINHVLTNGQRIATPAGGWS